MKWITKISRFVSGTKRLLICYGIIEDNEITYAYLVHIPTKKHYINIIKNKFSLITSEMTITEWDDLPNTPEGDIMHGILIKKFHQELVMASIIQRNKKLIDEGIINHKAIDN